MISVEEALGRLFDLIHPLGSENVSLRDAAGRWLAAPVTAQRTQPPFDASSMDGYAVNAVEVEQHAQFKVIGEAAAGKGFSGRVGAGQAVRIFTGAPLPSGADFVVIQEDVDRVGDLITVSADTISKPNIRAAGSDFTKGTSFDPARALMPNDIALLAAMNHPTVSVQRKPVVAILPTGDELVQPGETPGPDQIIASNSFGLAALLENAGADVRLLPAAKDSVASLTRAFALSQGADLVVTIGGASVGDHDLVGDVTDNLGMERSFYKIAMRPGKPLMAGKLGETALVGLPGNPVSAMVCGTIFILPMIRAMLGQPALPTPRATAPVTHDIGANGPREHYMRAHFGPDGLTIFDRQDSALLHLLTQANALAVRPVGDPARTAGTEVEFILL
ncbi:MAG: gephyrin-like molybdotransferase Glp [Pseudomonadota bacterium]